MKFLIIFLIMLFQTNFTQSAPVYILNDSCTTNIYTMAKAELGRCKNLEIHKEIRGVALRVWFDEPISNYYTLTPQLLQKLECVEYFLAKIKNPVIIEVHTGKFSEYRNIKNWELSAVIAGNIGKYFAESLSGISIDRIHTVGYGEFMPVINTPNNGGKCNHRVDIIILCNISGE